MAWLPVSSGSAGSTDGNGFTTGTIDTTGANFIIVAHSYLGTPQTLSDSKSNTWTALTAWPNYVSDRQLQFFYSKNATTGTLHTLTITGSGSYPSLFVAAFSGGDTTAPFDVENGTTGGTVTSVQTGSVTPGVANELLVAGLSYDDTTTITIDSGFTVATQQALVGAQHIGGALAYLIETTATAQNPTFSWTNSQRGHAAIATFKAAAAGDALQGAQQRFFM